MKRSCDEAAADDEAHGQPDPRHAQAEMRVVGENRLAGDSARSGDNPFVRRAVTDAGQIADLILDAFSARVLHRNGRLSRDRRPGPHARKHPGRLFRAELLAQMRP